MQAIRVSNVLALLLLAKAVCANVHTQDVTGIESRYGISDNRNEVLTIDLPAAFGLPDRTPLVVKGLSWNVTIGTFEPSWLNEASVYFDDAVAPGEDGFILTPGTADSGPGTNTYVSAGEFTFSEQGVPDVFLTEGMLRMEFHEDLDDGLPVDALWVAGTIHVRAEPYPAEEPVFSAMALSNGVSFYSADRISPFVFNEVQVSSNGPAPSAWQTVDSFSITDTSGTWSASFTGTWDRAFFRILSR